MKWKEIRRRAGALLLSVAIFVGSVPIGGYAAEEAGAGRIAGNK